MRDHSKHIELSREDAVAGLLDGSGFCAEGREPGIELVPLGQAFGRVLARNVAARCECPNMTTCMMDSVAVRWEAFADLGEGGLPDVSGWERGRDWDFANTGVAMPDGFDTAIRIEDVEISEEEQLVRILVAPRVCGAGTRPAGSSLHAGDVAARAGEAVTPDVAARIAAADHTVAPCAAKPRVAFIPTGNELVPAGVVPVPDANGRFAAAGKNFETNSLLVRGKVEQWGGVYLPFDIVPDDPGAIRAAIELACSCADIVVLNAGSSKGSDDWSCEVMEQMGQMICHETTHGPGHHSSAAIVDGVPVVGISGPSGGASFTLDFYLRPLVRAFLGLAPDVGKVAAVLACDFPRPPHGGPGGKGEPGGRPGAVGQPEAGRGGAGGRRFFGVRPVKVHARDDGMLVAEPVAGRPGSVAATDANAICMVAAGPDAPKAGDVVMVEMR